MITRPELSAARLPTSLFRRGGWLVALVLMIAAVGPAQGSVLGNQYRVAIDPATADVGSTGAEHTLTLTNSSGSTNSLTAVDVTVPAGIAVASPDVDETLTVTASDGQKQWTVTHVDDGSGSVLQFRAAAFELGGVVVDVVGGLLNALEPDESVSAAIKADVGCAAGDAATWDTTGRDASALPAIEFTAEAEPVLTVAHPPTTLAFTSQPTQAVAGRELNDVTVTAFDACGDVATEAAGNVSIAIADNPSGARAKLSGTLSQPLVGGVATFDNLSISLAGAGYTLRADHVTGSGTLSTESEPFNVVVLCTSSSTSCFVADGTTRVETPVPTGDATMALALGPAAPIAPCDPTLADPIGSWATIEPNGYAAATTTVTLTYAKAEAPGTGVANFVVCFWNDKTWLKLADCNKSSPKAVPPCISKRNRTGVGELVIELLIKTEDPIGGTYD